MEIMLFLGFLLVYMLFKGADKWTGGGSPSNGYYPSSGNAHIYSPGNHDNGSWGRGGPGAPGNR